MAIRGSRLNALPVCVNARWTTANTRTFTPLIVVWKLSLYHLALQSDSPFNTRVSQTPLHPMWKKNNIGFHNKVVTFRVAYHPNLFALCEPNSNHLTLRPNSTERTESGRRSGTRQMRKCETVKRRRRLVWADPGNLYETQTHSSFMHRKKCHFSTLNVVGNFFRIISPSLLI